MAQHGDGEDQPPYGGEDEGELCGQHRRNAEAGAELNEHKGDDQRNRGAADVAQAVADGGHAVHAGDVGHIQQEAVIVDARAGEAQRAQHVKQQKSLPAVGQRQQECADDAQQHEGGKELLFHAPEIAQRAQERREHRADQRAQRRGIAPVGRRIDGTHAAAFRHGLEKHGQDDGRHDGGEGGIRPVVENPGFFFLRVMLQHEDLLRLWPRYRCRSLLT